MSQALHVARVECRVALTVPDEVVEPNMGYVSAALGMALAQQVDGYVRSRGLGYYPAFDYFRAQPDAVDPALLSLIDEVAAFCAAYARRELRRRLSGAFSNVQVAQTQCTAYAMPRARPNQSDGPKALALHFSPNRLRLDLILSSIHKGQAEGIEELTVKRLTQWVRAPFERFELLSHRLLETGS